MQDKMKQVNKLLQQLSHLSLYKTKGSTDSGEAAGVELSCRSASRATAAHELRSLRADRKIAGSQPAAQNGSSRPDDYDQHPLQAANRRVAATAAPTAAADSNSCPNHPATAQGTHRSLQSNNEALLQQLLNQAWLADAPSSARLVLSLCCEVLADNQTQQQQQQQHDVLGIMRLVAAATSWQAASTHLQATLLLRALVSHYTTDAGALAAEGRFPELQEHYQQLQDAPAAALRAQLAAKAAAAAHSWQSGSSSSSSSGVLPCLTLLAACIRVGEAAQLKQEQPDSWCCLQQLAAARPAAAAATPQQGKPFATDSWIPLLQAWVSAVSAATPAAQQPEQQQQAATEGSAQMLPPQWQQLVSALEHLQQQVQHALLQPEQQQQSDPLQGALADTSASPATASVAAAGSAPPYELLQSLCRELPVLLQPADLEAAWVGTATPDSMAVVTLLRLAAATSRLWLPQLTASQSSSRADGMGPAGAADTTAGITSEQTPQPEQCVQPLHLGSSKDVREAAIWQGRPAEQVAAELGAAAPSAVAAAGSAAGKGSTPALRSPRNSWPDELLSTAQLWPGDVESEDDAAAITREERTLRAWINSVLHRGSTSMLSTGPDPPLGHSHSVDSDRLPRQGTGRTADGAGGVFRSSSAGAAAVAAQLEGARAAGSSSLAHSRSISADAQGAAAEDLSLDGWGCAEPAAPTTPTAAAAAAAGSAPAAPAGARTGAAMVPSLSSVSSLFGPELRSGVLLLEILELLQPGCVDQRLVNRPPFVSRTAQLKALENCNLALKVAQEELGLPLVSMSPRDIVLGRRKIILSLVYQLMRYNTMQLLESISAVHSEQQAGSVSRRSSATGGSEPSTPNAAAPVADDARADRVQRPGPLQLPPSGSRGWVNIRSSSRKQRRQVAITEADILDWANSKLQQVQPLQAGSGASATEVLVIRSFKDPVLATGVVLLQLLHVLAPQLVDPAFVTPGKTAAQRQSNARYALSLADRLGCSLFLVWEDLVDPPQPRAMLVLLASLMYQDLLLSQQQQRQSGE